MYRNRDKDFRREKTTNIVISEKKSKERHLVASNLSPLYIGLNLTLTKFSSVDFIKFNNQFF